MTGLDLEQKPSRRLWIFAGLTALALHLGGVALAVAHLRSDELDDAFGAPAIEIGLEMSSPRLDPTDLPPGPDTEASVASPALAEQKAEVKETDLPKDTPTETDNPDRVVIKGVTPESSGDLRRIVQDRLPEYDLSSGAENSWTLAMKPSQLTELKNRAVAQAIETIRNRIDQLGSGALDGETNQAQRVVE